MSEKKGIYILDSPGERFRFVEEKNGHRWGVYRNDQFQSCSRCLGIRPAIDTKTPCRGPLKMEFRK